MIAGINPQLLNFPNTESILVLYRRAARYGINAIWSDVPRECPNKVMQALDVVQTVIDKHERQQIDSPPSSKNDVRSRR